MQQFLIDLLECPACHGALDWGITNKSGDRIVEATARCVACSAVYPVREGIGVFLTPDLPRNDLWEQVESGISQYLHTQPDIERQLLASPADTLNPADQFFRSMVLEERGQIDEARALFDAAWPRLYTGDYRAGWQRQVDGVLARLERRTGPVIDLASGRGYLVEAMARCLDRPIVATDFSPRVLRGNQRRLRHIGLDGQISFLAFDARRTPFKPGSVPTLTTNLGLPNIEQPGDLLGELRRIVRGEFLAISHFFPEDDPANAAALREAGLSAMAYLHSTVAQFERTGWQVEVAHVYSGRALPTPHGELIDAGIDGLPVAETTLTWCTLIAR